CRGRSAAEWSGAGHRRISRGGGGGGRRHRPARRYPDDWGIPPRSGARRYPPGTGANLAMTAHTRGSGTSWVGRSIRRLEDPALVTGHGRFTADLPANHWVRFVRSSAAAGKLENITAPAGASIITAADITALKPIRPVLSKFNYVPVGQPILAHDVV